MVDLPTDRISMGTSNGVDVDVVERSADILEVRTAWTTLLAFAMAPLVGVVAGTVGFIDDGPARFLFLFGGGAFVLFGVALFTWGRRRIVLDRKTRTLRVGVGNQPRQWPWSAIKAVQLVDGRWHLKKGSNYFTMQLRLVLDDPAQRCIGISENPDQSWHILTGPRLAKFLDVPYVDQRSDPRPPKPAL